MRWSWQPNGTSSSTKLDTHAKQSLTHPILFDGRNLLTRTKWRSETLDLQERGQMVFGFEFLILS